MTAEQQAKLFQDFTQADSLTARRYGVNAEFTYPKYFSMIPLGPTPKSVMTKGFFETAIAQTPKPQTVAIVAADANSR